MNSQNQQHTADRTGALWPCAWATSEARFPEELISAAVTWSTTSSEKQSHRNRSNDSAAPPHQSLKGPFLGHSHHLGNLAYAPLGFQLRTSRQDRHPTKAFPADLLGDILLGII